MRTTSLRSAIFPITLSRPSRSQDSSKRDSGSRNSPGPKSSRRQRRFAVSMNLVVDGGVDLMPTFSSPAPHLFSSRIGNGARVCSTVVGARIHRQLWQARPKASPHLARRTQPFHRSFMTTEKATFGAGGFLGGEENFCKLKGVGSTAVGDGGGEKKKISYKKGLREENRHTPGV